MLKLQHSVKVPQLYKAASKIAKTVKEEGGSLKDLVFSYNKHFNIKGLYALIVKTLQNEDILDNLIRKSKILIKEERADPWLIRILITELLFGRKCLPGESKPVQTVLSYQETLTAELENSTKKGAFRLGSDQIQGKPRFVRVNTLSITIKDALKYFRKEDWKLVQQDETENYSSFLHKVSSLSEDEFIQDFHIKELFIFPARTEFYEHELYLNGSIILQDKASCLASKLLNPSPRSVTLDMCAAPGMKTTHLASLMKNEGTLYAVEMHKKRYQTLCSQVEKSGATCVKTLNCDALTLDSTKCPGVQYILVDPSCSGSGIVGRPGVDKEEKCTPLRLEKLAGFQILLLRHALTNFPDVKRVVYSTCSVNMEENEQVIDRVLALVNSDASEPIFEVVDSPIKDSWKHYGSENFEWGHKCLYAKSDVDFTNGFFVAIFEKVPSVGDDKTASNAVEKKKKPRRRKKHKPIEDSGENEESSHIKEDSEAVACDKDSDNTRDNNETAVKKKKKKRKRKNSEVGEISSVKNAECTENILDERKRNVSQSTSYVNDSDIKECEDANEIDINLVKKKSRKHKISHSEDLKDSDQVNEVQYDAENTKNKHGKRKSSGEEEIEHNANKRRKISDEVVLDDNSHEVNKPSKRKLINREEVKEMEAYEDVQAKEDHSERKKSKKKKHKYAEIDHSMRETIEDTEIILGYGEDDIQKKKKKVKKHHNVY